MGSGNAGLSRRNSGSLKHQAPDVQAEENDYSLDFVEPSEVYGIDNSYRASYFLPESFATKSGGGCVNKEKNSSLILIRVLLLICAAPYLSGAQTAPATIGIF